MRRTTTTALGPIARNGLEWTDIEVGTGRKVNAGDAILCYYEGTYETTGNSGPFGGVVGNTMNRKTVTFDATDPGEPFEVVVGKGQVIEGWDLGVLGDLSLEIEPMRVGGDRRLVIPAALAYGSEGAGGGAIPPNTDLKFQIAILNAQPSGGVSASTQIKGIAGLVAFLGVMAVFGFVVSQNIPTLRTFLLHE